MRNKAVVAAVAALITVGTAGAASAATTWSQGFESDTAGWQDADSGWYGSIERVASGTGGIGSAGGDYHAVVNGDESSAPFSDFGGYETEWPGDWVAELDVYLDPSWAAGAGFDYTVAATGSDGNHQRDFIFHVTKDSSTGALLVGGSNNTDFTAREDLEDRNHAVVEEAGWYTLQHRFHEDGGVLAVDLNLVDSDGTVLFTETRSTSADAIEEVAGNGYAWFTFSTVEDLAIDNHELYLAGGPAGKDDCKDGGWELYEFANQGQCVAGLRAAAQSR